MIAVLGVGVAVFGAGIAYRLGGRRDERVSVRIVCAILMFLGGTFAIPLFGPEDANSSFLKMAAALWLPQLLLGAWWAGPALKEDERLPAGTDCGETVPQTLTRRRFDFDTIVDNCS
ncbi:hypothetical protein [Marmoricola sp. RAF53]|uniref:hypothetical protein n=1 Tax=Marmoricola sp. RAF53 TaxID=3233059 RepID=UPI003F992D6B